MSSKLKIGIIGLGGIANFHIAGVQASDDAEVWAICDVNPEALRTRGDELGIPEERRYESHEALLSAAGIDGVMIGTPNFNHYTIASEAIRQGIPFALEKPIAMNAHEARLLHDQWMANPVPHIVCFTYRYKAAARYAKRLIEEGKLGKIHHIYSQYLQGWAVSEDIPLVWRFNKALSGSGALGDLGSHILDLHRFLVGETESVSAEADTIIRERELVGGGGKGAVDVDDYCHVLARMEDGVTASMEISRFALGRGNYQRIEVYGSEGALVYNLEERDELELLTQDDSGSSFRQVVIPEEYRADQMQSFFNLLKGNGDGLDATVEDGYINQLTIDCILESAAEGRRVHIQDGRG
ncbi:Gfo/Idh/MocA family protein [Cohnella algarum]|uniref:Gfo/Idh/MocA family protein n=1 Tax=Cohnella algarum TaxID=2044859 RepID=UPI0019687DFB|nr:Gfo/Idh/MocA family oxidoreductase [Cohnella algarum]MBN2982314.1 Gfo/Idh/MocA family oxidoreductase [Cohnella algarum]